MLFDKLDFPAHKNAIMPIASNSKTFVISQEIVDFDGQLSTE